MKFNLMMISTGGNQRIVYGFNDESLVCEDELINNHTNIQINERMWILNNGDLSSIQFFQFLRF
jgi:hypothetical protein